MIGYTITRPQYSSAMLFAGTTIDEILAVIRDELRSNEGQSPDEIEPFTVSASKVTKKQIAEMGEFQGW